ncbi:hypothetical protein G6F46_001347 [Rhizopus delemar]|uniref:Pinin/SDK/MemA protein domain-containing protein n=3 Tax=Rhizopus TaxID=4842 RepID=I1BYQ3_RHIO9|nr:hypothetical protein RO3G_06038 [Rhizopus delemar RA 99-880]KAG1053652.1 hypothetical protein G6F43_004289 [Rhizopus delemar]KAG1553854.1 hypothetical protein G6F51_000325 [Rhizopus arrhizus]KAG1466181.1 hypothetical protein G6F55_000650 [Rhizopus delemar]KAG1516014.1 hypothetical protein G6F53_002477 [Rhizopus delemar]|eukprot:EIE81333.1 hypothetical protein RO3G_06038 [Rhizopus delemar RA 99-880]
MVQSSIVIPTNSSVASSKRAVDETEDKTTENEKPQEIKRPRLEINEAGRNRNKRLFGVLLGTLNKFKDDTEQTSEVDKKRREINQKLQEKLDSEKRAILEKIEARKLEKERMEQMKKKEEEKIIAEKKELFEVEQKKMLANFLKTTTEPNLYYLPDKLTDEMSQTIEKQVQDALAAKRSFEGRREMRMQDSRDDDKLSDNEDD